MTSCAEVRGELVAVLRGESSACLAAEVERHLDDCAPCSAERDALVLTMGLLARHVHPESSPDARMRLAAALADEFAASRRRRRARRLVPFAALPAALAAGALAAFWAAPRTRDAAPAVPPETARAALVGLPAEAADAATRGLAWLASRQRADGTWAPSGDADPEATAAATASVLLAFEADGQTPRRGPRADALRRAAGRLAELVAAGFVADEAKKPVYALALSARALSTAYRLDRDAMTTAERRRARDLLGDAGRSLVLWQGSDGGFGYVPQAARSDASCTLFAVAALVELKEADVLEAGGALARAGGYLAKLRTQGGGVAYSDEGGRHATPALTAARLALDGELGRATSSPEEALASIEQSLAAGGDALLAWNGAEALARHGRPLETPVRTLLAGQRGDGAWPAANDLRCAEAGDAVTTAFGVLALSRSYAR